jgi:hypothetical protein
VYSVPTNGTDSNGQPVAYADILGRGHTVYVSVTAELPSGAQIARSFTVLGGSVQVDRGAQFRRSLDLDVAPVWRDGTTGLVSSVIPTSASDALSPYGTLLRVQYGMSVPGQTSPFWWPQGLFRVSQADVDDDGVPSLKVKGYDLSRTISKNKLSTPWVVAAGQNVGDSIVSLALNRYPYLQYRAHSVTQTFPALVVLDPEKDPWEAITEWAASAGCEAFFDTDGYLTIRTVPDPTSDPVVWTYQDAGDGRNAVMAGVSRSLSDDPGYNGVILTSDSPNISPPLRSEAWDANPSSPTYYLGQYGKVPKFVTNAFVGTQTQADAAAAAELRRVTGGTEGVTMTCVPNPAHEAGDTIRVIRPASGVNQTTVLESFTLPFVAGDAMQLTFRERRTTS